METPLLELNHIIQYFPKAEGRPLRVLENVNLTLHSGEILGLLGKSGSGKSTLLRIIAGLIRPSSGTVTLREHAVSKKELDIAMVFQTFALFPWLTVLDNVQLGLEALGVSEKEKRKRALEAIDLIGLDGYESAYPRELSGGMKQRVGFARALVVNPELLLMDEPFSALDVLTAETLKTDFLDLWVEKKMPLKSVLLVTHNIEEAVLMSDRIIIFAANPGRIAAEIKVNMPHPRDRQASAFRDMVEEIYTFMTSGMAQGGYSAAGKSIERGMYENLPRVSPNRLAGLMEALAGPPYHGRADLPALDHALGLSTEEVLQIAEAMQLLKFAEVREGDIHLTTAGKAFADADTQRRKQIFAEHLLQNAPLAAYIHRVLQDRPGNHAPRIRFLAQLEDYMSEHEASEALNSVTSWARYAELFAYNDNTETFSLENPTA
ncbi:MAG: nitrate/sulfonate/bicarbonate ABC transporter ATP-binding protein [Alphaproteobacteria bacterium]|nr:nitrate/sulfonate/bicarbonate ABC transporter ATP-binding protein [Alphaproteobacteria bacterium]